MTTAVAIFVKTPGRSPVKTRLAAALGTESASAFHILAARAVAEAASAAHDRDGPLQAYWAVAEADALDDPLWRELPRMHQGDGGLGERLHHVHGTLLASHDHVLLLGADAPQVTPELLCHAADVLTSGAAPLTLGEASDGGFWLFGGSRPVTRETWRSIGYSRDDTCAQLRAALRPFGDIAELPVLGDVDDIAGLHALHDVLIALPSLLTSQRHLLRWLSAAGDSSDAKEVLRASTPST